MSVNTSHKGTSGVSSPNPSKRRFDQTGTPPSSTRSPLNGSPASSNKRQHRELADDRLNAIEEHGVIGNMRTCALISVSAEVCWFCYPNFDSPSVFASILDREKGGSWTISAYIDDGKDAVNGSPDSSRHSTPSNKDHTAFFPAHDHDTSAAPTTLPPAPPTVSHPPSSRTPTHQRNNPQPTTKKLPSKTSAEHQQQRELVRRYVTHKQLYHSDTNVLISRFLSDDGVGQVLDYMPAGKVTESAKRWLVRELAVVRGQMTFQVELTPAFNYARDSHTVSIEPYGARFVSEKLAMELRTTRKLDWDLTDDGKGVTCLVELSENEREVFIFCESERCPGGDWKTGGSEDALFVSNEPQKKDEVRHEWNEGVDELVNPPTEADGSPRTGKDHTSHNGSGKAEEATAGDGKQAEPQRAPESKDGADAAEGGDSSASGGGSGSGSGSGALGQEGGKGWMRKALGEIVWRSTNSLARAMDREWEAKQDAQRAMGRQSSRNRQTSRNKAMQRTTSATSKPATTDKNNGTSDSTPNKDVSTAATSQGRMDKGMPDDADDGKLADDSDSDHVLLSDDDIDMSDDDDADQPNDDHDGSDPLSIRRVSVDVAAKLRDHTINFWRDWIGKCTYNGRWREQVFRSALVLKLMTFEPTGAIVAALTTSLPEEVRGERNWDYRFTWIRDSSFVLYAFLKLGFKDEAAGFMQWISQRCEESSQQDGSLQIMYGLHGEHKLEEKQLSHLAGYKDSRPVRIGNDAYAQVQLDIYGELMDTVYLSNKYAEPISYDFWQHVRKMVDWVCEHWHIKDEGIWETRGGKKDFVYSKVMCWVAIDRGIRLAEKRSFPCQLSKWRKVRDDIYEEVQTKGWNGKAYTQSYGSDVLDASVLIMPLVFFAAPTDPRFVSTLEQILQSTSDGGLVSNNLVFRYNAETGGDGLKGQEGTFSICTFWAVEAAARLGVYRRDFLERSRYMFEQMLGYANHVGLFSEEIGKRGEHLGNFPQAFTHLALISAAINLDKALTHRVPGTSTL